jgi:hypothetical protein
MPRGLVLTFVFLAMTLCATAQPNVTVDSPFQVHYFANLNQADSFINITNTGATNANLCTNVYTFSPDEQEISCCSCVVTPNALVSLSVKNDLISNTLTPAIPTSVVVKLLASTGGACNAAVPGALASGLLAWGSTYRQITKTVTTPSPYWWQPPTTTTTTTAFMAETPFLPSTLSAGELARISAFCGNIQANGSGFGICRSCRLGGM